MGIASTLHGNSKWLKLGVLNYVKLFKCKWI